MEDQEHQDDTQEDIQDNQDDQHQDGEQNDGPDWSSEDEQSAREMGWVPREEYRGNEEDWRDPKEFVRRGEEILPIVRSQLNKTRAELNKEREASAQREKEHKDQLSRMEHMSRVAIDQVKENAKRDFSERKRSAVQDGDVDTYNAIEQEEAAALAEIEEKAKPPEPEKPKDNQNAYDALPDSQKQVVEDWVAENGWYEKDPVLNSVAVARFGEIDKEKPGMTLAEKLADTREFVKGKFPEKFGVQTNGSGGGVEGGTRTAGGGSRSSFTGLPADARQHADNFIEKDGLFLSPEARQKWEQTGQISAADKNAAREAYAKEYNA